MKKIKQLAIITAMFALSLPTVILADVPSTSDSFSVSGNVTIDGENAPVGTVISVEKDSQNIASTAVTFEGKYLVEISKENAGETLVYQIDGFLSISEDANPNGNPSSQTIDLAFITAEQEPDPEESTPDTTTTVNTGGGGGGGGGGGDTTPPTNISIIINSNNETTVSTEVVLTLSAIGAGKMMIADNSSFTGAEWETYAVEKNWALTGKNGEKIVYAKFKDTAGNMSSSIQDAIILSISGDEEEEEVVVLGEEMDYRTLQINKILSEAGYICVGNADSAAQNRNKQRNQGEETEIHNRYVARLTKGINGLMQSNINAFTNFILYSTETTDILGAGERAGILNSYKSAFGKLPATESEWQDVLKIGNGRWPNQRSETAENNAKKEFKKVYKREANMENANDDAAVTVMAYGLRPDVRNLNNEKAGIKSFKHIYGYNPSSAVDWDIVRAIAYSGAVR